MSEDVQPSPRLPLSGEDAVVVDKVIDKMAADFRRSGVSFDHVRVISESDERWAQVDKIIADGVDSLRPVLKQDFVEKLAERVMDRSSNDDPMHSINTLGYRLLNTLLLVVAVTGKFRGKTRRPAYEKVYATSELKRRGLWKK